MKKKKNYLEGTQYSGPHDGPKRPAIPPLNAHTPYLVPITITGGHSKQDLRYKQKQTYVFRYFYQECFVLFTVVPRNTVCSPVILIAHKTETTPTTSDEKTPARTPCLLLRLVAGVFVASKRRQEKGRFGYSVARCPAT